MSASQVIAPRSFALERRLADFRNVTRSIAFADFRGDVAQAVKRGLAANVMAGKDGMGRPMAKLAPSTLRSRKGSGPPLAPHGQNSRVFTRFRAEWIQEGPDWVLKRYWEGMDDEQGRPFMQYHMTGTPRMPKRDVSQIPQGAMAEIRRLHWALLEKLTRPGGSR